jgi:hypothetical protein
VLHASTRASAGQQGMKPPRAARSTRVASRCFAAVEATPLSTLLKGSTRLKLTIDADDALEGTLRVVGAVYGVTLEVSPSGGDKTRIGQINCNRTSTSGRPTRASGARALRRPGKRARSGLARATKGASGQLSTAAVRSGARENGHAVADRGRVPAGVVSAYRNAQPAWAVR